MVKYIISDLSCATLCGDVIGILKVLYPGGVPPIILLGHRYIVVIEYIEQ